MDETEQYSSKHSEDTKQNNCKKKLLKWAILFSLFAARLVPNRFAPIRVSGGLLQGIVSPDGKVVAYYGVPYATVQTRFQAAVPDPKWEGVLQAQEENIRCSQWILTAASFVSGREDCLTLNIYTPTKDSQELRHVMVFVHGGGFKDGSGSPYLYGPEYFLQHDIILVTINYRVDVLGFLCLDIPEAPGNIGLKDQVEALRWVQQNIEAFGGDPDKVTLFGESAGAASVSYHLLSPMSKGLFSKVIMQSGTALGSWAFQYDPVAVAHKFAQQIGEDTEDLHELVNKLREKTDYDLIKNVIQRKPGEIMLAEYYFCPCKEKEIPGVDRFLSDHPYNLLSEGNYTKVPILMGYNNGEGIWFVLKEKDEMLATFDFVSSLPDNLKFTSKSEKESAGNKLKSFYLPNSPISKETRKEFSRYEGDVMITYPVIWTLEEFIKTSDFPVYAYKFTHEGKLNIIKRLSRTWDWPGAAHADELFYLFKTKIPFFMPSSADIDVVNKMTTMWTNFVKYSDPTPEKSTLLPLKWKPATERDQQVFVIDNELSYTQLYEDDVYRFWRSLYKKHFKKL